MVLDNTRGKLHHWLYILLKVHSSPIIVLEVKVKHFVRYLPILVLTSEDNHGIPVDRAAMVLTWLHAYAFGFNDIDAIV